MTKLKELVKERGRTQRWVADQLGVKRLTFNGYCNGYRKPKEERRKLIANLLGVEEKDLID